MKEQEKKKSLNELEEEAEQKLVQEEEELASQGGKKKWLLLLVAVMVLVASIFVIRSRFASTELPNPEEIVAAEGGLAEELPEGMTAGEYGDILQQKIDDSMFTINLTARPVFDNGTSKGVIDITNNPGNKYPCKIALTLNETGEEIYRCEDLIYPGQYIHEIKLAKNLEKGAYDVTATYYVYDEKGEQATGIMEAGITVVIQN